MTVLLAVTGRVRGVRYALEHGASTLGRSSGCTIQLLDEAVSRRHAEVRIDASGAKVVDLGGANGTALNGVRIEGEARLTAQDVISIGATTFVFEPDLDYLPVGEGADVIIAGAPSADDLTRPRVRDVPPVEDDERAVRGDERPGENSDAASVLLELVARALSEPGSSEGGPSRAAPREVPACRAKRGWSDPIRAALEVVARRFGAERAFILRAATQDERAKVLASFGQGPITVSRTVVERVLRERRARVFGDAPRHADLAGGLSLAAGEIRSLLAAPLVVDGRAFGLVHLDRRSRDAYGPADLEAFVPVVNVLALVVLASAGLEGLVRRAQRAHQVTRPTVVAESPVMQRLVAETERVAASNATVLITGETGTGKEVLARLLHAESPRRQGPFVAVNCAALPEALQESELFGHVKGAFTGADRDKPGLFEAADGGTLFLDELGDAGRAVQVKLLRALQERVVFRVGATQPVPVDVRIVAATAKKLEDLVASGAFRDDLFFRLAVVRLEPPPLRKRPEDLAPLARAFAQTLARELGVLERPPSPELLEAFARHDWPGNVRELRNVIERLVIHAEGELLDLGDLPDGLLGGRDHGRRAVRAGGTLAEAVAELEREMILRAQSRTGAVKAAVADALGISRVTLDKKLAEHGIPWPRRR